jgi:hypothetical protein
MGPHASDPDRGATWTSHLQFGVPDAYRQLVGLPIAIPHALSDLQTNTLMRRDEK